LTQALPEQVGTEHSVPVAGQVVPQVPQLVTVPRLVQAPEQQAEPLEQASSGLLSLLGSLLHVPSMPGIAHELHALPVHALLQQYPSAQKPLSH